MSQTLLWITCLTLTFMVNEGEGHGRLLVPPGRATMWREGFSTPVDYNDNQLYCGGFWHQWHEEDGKCGVCGDPYELPQPRPQENGGRYGTGTIARTYSTGDVMEVQVQITAAHKGYFEFRLCPLSDLSKPATPECLDENLLRDTQGKTRFLAGDRAMTHHYNLQLPVGLSCQQCVLQWKYHAGNNWGTDASGTGIGHGPQEEFYGCSDIQITPGADGGRTTTPRDRIEGKEGITDPSDTSTDSGYVDNSVEDENSSSDKDEDSDGEFEQDGVRLIPIRASEAVKRTDTVCLSANLYKGAKGMDAWCKNNCFAKVSYCPPNHCACFVRVEDQVGEERSESRTTEATLSDSSSSQVYNDPPSNGAYGDPTPHGSYNDRTIQGSVDDLATQEAYHDPPTQNPYNYNTSQDSYVNPSTHDSYDNPTTYESYNDPMTTDIYNDPAFPEIYEDLVVTTEYGTPSESTETTSNNPFICVFQNNVLDSAELDQLCSNNCNWETGTCTSDLCVCYRPCARYVAYGHYTGNARMDLFCQVTCQAESGRCPSSVCTCADNTQRQPYCSGTGELAGIPEFGRFCEVMCTEGLQELCPDYCICF